MNENPYTKIQEKYQLMHKAEKKIADTLLRLKGNVVELTVRELAEKSNVAESSIIRFCKSLGYNGFLDLKNILEKYSNIKTDQVFEDIHINDDFSLSTEKVFLKTIETLKDTLSNLDENTFSSAVDYLYSSEKILFLGIGSSSSLVLDSYYRFGRIGLPASFATDPHIMQISSNMLNSNCTAIAITHTGRTKDTVDSLRIAKLAGAKTIAITSFDLTPITKIADLNLIISSKESIVLNEAISSRIAHLTILDCLYVALALKLGVEAIENINSMNLILERLRY